MPTSPPTDERTVSILPAEPGAFLALLLRWVLGRHADPEQP